VLEDLVGQFRDVLQILSDEGASERNRLPKIREACGDPAEALAQCNEHIAYAGQFDLPFMLVPYRTQRSLLFQCLDVLPLQSNSQDRAVLVALAWLQGFRNAHREYLLLTDNDLANLPLDWLPEKWERAVLLHGRDSRMLPLTLPGPSPRKKGRRSSVSVGQTYYRIRRQTVLLCCGSKHCVDTAVIA